jgi:hypothetical protein
LISDLFRFVSRALLYCEVDWDSGGDQVGRGRGLIEVRRVGLGEQDVGQRKRMRKAAWTRRAGRGATKE